MTHTMNVHEDSGILIQGPGVGILMAYGKTVPADTTAGYAIGCIFIHIDGTAGTTLYANEGTLASADFDAVSVA